MINSSTTKYLWKSMKTMERIEGATQNLGSDHRITYRRILIQLPPFEKWHVNHWSTNISFQMRYLVSQRWIEPVSPLGPHNEMVQNDKDIVPAYEEICTWKAYSDLERLGLRHNRTENIDPSEIRSFVLSFHLPYRVIPDLSKGERMG
jgi:hypothetical protein